MPTIGGITVDLMNGNVLPMSQRLEAWQIPGVDGYGAQKLGLGNGDFPLSTTAFKTSLADADAHILACEALVGGDPVTIVDQFGDTYTLAALVIACAPAKSYVKNNGAAAWRCDVQFSLLRVT